MVPGPLNPPPTYHTNILKRFFVGTQHDAQFSVLIR